jgi:4-hydroxy-tetrahydrodipicolinate synthase
MTSKRPDWFKGIFPALVTPFTATDEVDEATYRALIRYLLPHVDGVVPCGTTGEFSSMSIGERKRAIEICVDEVAGRVPVVAGTGCTNTREALELTTWAKEAGAAAALVVAPYFLKPTFNEVFDHYQALDEIGLPIIMYNIPQCAGTHYRWWTAEGMALALGNVVGIKDSSGDMPFMMALFEKLGGIIGIFCGNEEIVAPALASGADGAILASANFVPDIWQEMYQAVQRGDLATARQRQKELQIVARLVMKGGSQCVKEGLRMVGFPVSDSRHPVMPGDAFAREDAEDLRTQLENLGKIGKTKKTIGGVQVDYAATLETPAEIGDLTMCTGEGFAGPPISEIAHIDLVLGRKDGPVGRALERALREERPGHELKVISERPRTLLVPTVTIRTRKAEQLVYGEAAEGIKLAIEHSIAQGFLPEPLLDELCIIANVFVHPAASIKRRVQINNYKAMRGAIRKAVERRPSLAELLNERAAARHPFRYAP